jgi:hypothetical protein
MGLAAFPTPASEPHGEIVLEWEWLDAATHPATSNNGLRLLRVVAEPVPALQHGAAVVDLPEAVAAEPLGPPGEDAPPFAMERRAAGARRLRLDRGPWPAGRPFEFLLAVQAPPKGGAILEIRVEGTGADGRTWSEVTGVTVGRPGGRGRVRGGAVEYRAAPGDPR